MDRWLSRCLCVAGAVLMSACASSNPPPADDGLPPSTVTTPTASATPSDDELVKQAQAAYQVAFEELERLARAGGADRPSAKMVEYTQDLYLKQDLALLQFQKTNRIRVEGRAATARSRSSAGAVKGDADARLTLQVCEDRRGSTAVYPDGRRDPNVLSQGWVYGRVVDGRVKLVDVDTREVQRCDW